MKKPWLVWGWGCCPGWLPYTGWFKADCNSGAYIREMLGPRPHVFCQPLTAGAENCYTQDEIIYGLYHQPTRRSFTNVIFSVGGAPFCHMPYISSAYQHVLEINYLKLRQQVFFDRDKQWCLYAGGRGTWYHDGISHFTWWCLQKLWYLYTKL